MTLVDLSHSIEHEMTTYPGLPGPAISDFLSREASRERYEAGTEFQIGEIRMVANTGTYLDTPAHRYEDGFDLSQLPLERVAGLSGVCLAGEGAIASQILDGHNVSGRAVLFSTGWDRHWRTGHYGHADHPYLTTELAQRLVDEGAALVGIDSVNIDSTTGGSRPIHSALLAAGIPLVEHLTGLEQLVGASFRFFAVPPKVKGMGTFPVRAFAMMEAAS
jgi:kynurenine formamidase